MHFQNIVLGLSVNNFCFFFGVNGNVKELRLCCERKTSSVIY